MNATATFVEGVGLLGPYKYIELEDGRHFRSTAELYRLEREEYLQNYGSFSTRLLEELRARGTDAPLDVLVFPDTRPMLSLIHESGEGAARFEDFREAVAPRVAEVEALVRGTGAQVVSLHDTGIPMIRVLASGEQLEVLRHSPAVILVDPYVVGTFRRHTPPDHVITHWIDFSYNANGIFGAGVDVGVIEDFTADSIHEAFSGVGLFNVDSSGVTPCLSDSDCPPYVYQGDRILRCQRDLCG